MSQNFDVVVIGAGPGGYVAAIRCGQLGLKTAIIEKEYLGGVCLNVGCIPSKAMISAAHFLHRAKYDAPEMGFEIPGEIKINMKKMLSWKESVTNKMAGGVAQLLKANGVSVIKGEAQFKTVKELSVKTQQGVETISAKNFIIATGSRPIEIPNFAFDENYILSSTGALALDEIPAKLLVVGGGYIGLEIGSYLAKFGSQVVVAEAQSAILSGVVDSECAQVVARKLKKNKIEVMLNTKVKTQKKTANGIEVTVELDGREQSLTFDKVLVTVGRRPNSDQTNLKGIGLQIDERGFVKVNEQRRTNHSHIFCIGDIAGQPMLAHKASYEGVMVAEIISGINRVYDVKMVPAVVFTDPEIASAGMTEDEARVKGYKELLVSKFPFGANGRAVSMMETDGFVKMIADANTHILLGVHIVGPEASNLISEAALAIEMGARLEDLALTIHPHPTLGETMMETAEATLGHAIHMIHRPLNKTKEAGATTH